MIAVLIPDRGDRPEMLQNCLRMLANQTMKIDYIEIVNDAPSDSRPDITKRYRIGYKRLSNKGFECIFLIENDDYYAPNYIETMYNKWIECNKPDILGLQSIIYYHIGLFAWFNMKLTRMACACNTVLKADLYINWCNDNEPFTDTFLWKELKGVLFEPQKPISLGIKHGTGKCGGLSHTNKGNRYIIPDNEKNFLRTQMDVESYQFYSTYMQNHG